MTLVIMAAGMGNRYGGLKQIDPVGPNGEFIIDYSIYDSIKVGCDRVIFIIKEENLKVFRETVGRRIEGCVKVDYAFQRIEDIPCGTVTGRTKPWGTTQAVLSCKGIVNEEFMVINADDFYGRDAYRIVFEHLSSGKSEDFCMPGYILRNTLSENGHVARGVCKVNKDGCLTDIVERKKIMRIDGRVKYCDKTGKWNEIDQDSVVSMNFWGFSPSVFELFEQGFRKFLCDKNTDLTGDEYLLAPAVGEIIAGGKYSVSVLNTSAKWFGVTYKEDKKFVSDYIRDLICKGDYPNDLWGK